MEDEEKRLLKVCHDAALRYSQAAINLSTARSVMSKVKYLDRFREAEEARRDCDAAKAELKSFRASKPPPPMCEDNRIQWPTMRSAD